MKIIQEREMHEGVNYEIRFARRKGDRNLNGGGYGFPCDADGNPDWEHLAQHPEAMVNLNNCLMGEAHFVGFHAERWTYRTERIGKCECGEEVYLDRFTNTCDCGADYDSNGNQLAPRSQWGEETGEHWSECY